MKKIKVGIVGFGLSGSEFHAPSLKDLPEFEITWVMSSQTEKVKKVLHQVKITQNYEDILNDPEVDLVIITSPNEYHYKQSCAALEKNKHVVLEKPFVPTVSEGEKLRKLAIKKKRILSVYHNRRYDGDFQTVKNILSSGVLGEIYFYESHFDRFRPNVNKQNWREDEKAVAGGILFDLGPHLIDQAITLFGEPKKILYDVAIQRNEAKQPDYFHLVLKYARVRCVLHASCVAYKTGPRFLIHGDKGSFKIEDFQSTYGELYLDGVEAKKIPLGETSYAQFYRDLYQAIVHEKKNPVTAEEALMSLKIILESC
ncbi:MAG: Gfo/Idh/MocA family oxidoreductase [Bacteriovoracaceae bacterium]|nr:Gfo/Idh/MocA family oxidoreductase [Bacteriovoracaceae bacterium]